MADSAEHGKRSRRRGVSVYGGTTRVEEMRAFTEKAPSILAATNLVGSGLDIPAADLIVVTDSDAFGESEIEQLIGRVGRREHPSDAVLDHRDDLRKESVARDGRRPRPDLHAARHARQQTPLPALEEAEVSH
jgi:superfamily II DNA or RNA helicase